jgi:hypothetical protein
LSRIFHLPSLDCLEALDMEMTRNAEKCRTMGENREEGRKIRRENMNSWRGEKKRRREGKWEEEEESRRNDERMDNWIQS